MKFTLNVELAKGGNVLLVRQEFNDGTQACETVLVPGTVGSANLRDRTRRLAESVVRDWFPPTARRQP